MTSKPQPGHGSGVDDRFAGLLQRLNLDACFEDFYRDLAGYYSEPGRYYHNLQHVRQCLGVLDDIHGLLRDPDAAELALWFHDIVYDPGSHDNELRSALLFDRRLGVHLPTARADSIHAMIMATVHPSDAREPDQQFVADIDLSGMGLKWSKFLSDTDSLRMECQHLTDSEFQLGTLGFFNKLLSRPSIYLTDYFKGQYEEQARRNILDLISRLDNDKEQG